jgi:cytochrome P450
VSERHRSSAACLLPATDARFDPALDAWVLSRHADVVAALRDPLLSASATSAASDRADAALREVAAEMLSPARLAALRTEIESSARRLCGALPGDRPVDLVRELAEPWALGLAAAATGAPAAEVAALSRLAREVFLEAASATGGGARTGGAAAELARSLQGTGASIGVQAFVALSQTLPGFLAAAWLELFRHPAQVRRLRAEPALLPAAVEELLRCAGPARAVFRHALGETRVGEARIGRGERVALMLAAANHDPERFREPHRLDFQRDAAGHLAFGRGAHYCSGARLIRLASAAATGALLAVCADVEVVGPVEWIGGFAIRVPATLPAVLHRPATPDAARATPAATTDS